MDEKSGRKRTTIYREAALQGQCMTWLLEYFHISWVVHGGAQGRGTHRLPLSTRPSSEAMAMTPQAIEQLNAHVLVLLCSLCLPNSEKSF